MGLEFLTLGVSIDVVLLSGLSNALRLVCQAQQGWRCAVVFRAHFLVRAAKALEGREGLTFVRSHTFNF